MKRQKYKITWGEGQSQTNLTKTEALKIAADLLVNYKNVLISKQ